VASHFISEAWDSEISERLQHARAVREKSGELSVDRRSIHIGNRLLLDE
jgi:hypothetical protein